MKKFSVSVCMKGFSAVIVKQHIAELTLASGVAFVLLVSSLFAAGIQTCSVPERRMESTGIRLGPGLADLSETFSSKVGKICLLNSK